jgi:hypothetical protein
MATTFLVEVKWSGTTWTDETSRMRRARLWSGFERPGDFVAAVGRCALTFDNTDRRFSPGNTGGALYGSLNPRREVRVKASDGVTTWTLFRGYIERILPDAGEWAGGECVIECVDAIALLARQAVGVAHEDSKAVDEAVAAVVASAYTPPASSYSDNGDSLSHYGRGWNPEDTTALQALREIAEAVYGRFYIARDGTAAYISRDDRQDSSAPVALALGAYHERALATQPARLIAYWRLNESAGTVVEDSSDANHDGTATGVTWGQGGIGDGYPAAGFDGVNDVINVYSAGLAGAFDGSAGTLMAWFKVGVGAWTDGASRILVEFEADADNYVRLSKLNTPTNTLRWRYRAGGTTKSVDKSGVSDSGWLCVALTWDKSANQMNAYFNGAQEGATQTGLGTWAGSLASTASVIGAISTAAANPWHGDVAHVAIWDVALSASEIAALGAV